MAACLSAVPRAVRSRTLSVIMRNIRHRQQQRILDKASFHSLLYLDRRNINTGNGTSTLECYDARQVDVTSGKSRLVFDTHAVVKSLKQEGMAEEQAEVLVNILAQISQTNAEQLAKEMVTKAQQEILLQQVMSHISSVKKDMVILEKSEFANLKHQYEKQQLELETQKQHMLDELSKLNSGVKLDLNLERARATEAHSTNERKLGDLVNRIEMLQSENEKRDNILEHKIDKEIANLLATYERYRYSVITYAAGTIISCMTICLGFYRIWVS